MWAGLTRYGFVASVSLADAAGPEPGPAGPEGGSAGEPLAAANYARVWARDGVICGLAGLAAGEAALTAGLADTLDTLAAHQGPRGEIPAMSSPSAGR